MINGDEWRQRHSTGKIYFCSEPSRRPPCLTPISAHRNPHVDGALAAGRKVQRVSIRRDRRRELGSFRVELIPFGSRSGSVHWPVGPERVVIQMSESSLSKLVDRLKYSVMPSALGVGNASNAPVLSRAPKFMGGLHGWSFDARVATYISALP